MPRKPSHLSPYSALAPGEVDHRSKMAGLPQEKMELDLGLLAGAWTCVPGCLTLLKHKSMAHSFPQQVCNTAHKTRDRWRKAGKQWGTAEPVQKKDPPSPISCLQLFPDSFYCFFFFLFQYQVWVWCFPLPPSMLTPEPNTGSVPSSCDTGLSQGGWAKLGITLLLSLIHLSAYPSSHPEPTLFSPARTNVHAGKAPQQRGQRVASSVPNPLLYILAFPFPPQKNLPHFAWGQLARELPEVPPTMTPGSVCPRAPLRKVGLQCLLNGSVTDGLSVFSYAWKNYCKNGKKLRNQEKQTNKADVPRVHRQNLKL